MTPSPTPSPQHDTAAETGTETGADDWSRRWSDDDATDPASVDRAGIRPASAEPAGAVDRDAGGPVEVRRPRITHLVLVDGLPADHWVEDGSDGFWEAGAQRRGAAPSSARSAGRVSRERELRWLDVLVGGREALLALDDRPLVTRPLDLGAAPDDVRERALTVSAECDRVVAEVFANDELVAAARHLFEAALAADPGMLSRSTRDDTATGALVWAAGQANGLIGPEGQLLARDLWSRLGIPPSAAGRGAAMLERLVPGASLLAPPAGAPRLRPTGLPGALLAVTRSLIIRRRDEALIPVS